jgi:transposase
VENEIMKFLPEEAVELTKIPGIGPISAATIYAELGDVNRFESSKQVASYAGVSPRTKQSRKIEFHNGLIKGNNHLSSVLFLVARSAKNTAQFNGFYQALLKRTSNSKKATLALANKMCRIVYHVLKDGEYKEGARVPSSSFPPSIRDYISHLAVGVVRKPPHEKRDHR